MTVVLTAAVVAAIVFPGGASPAEPAPAPPADASPQCIGKHSLPRTLQPAPSYERQTPGQRP